jgi:hypothetical protein
MPPDYSNGLLLHPLPVSRIDAHLLDLGHLTGEFFCFVDNVDKAFNNEPASYDSKCAAECWPNCADVLLQVFKFRVDAQEVTRQGLEHLSVVAGHRQVDADFVDFDHRSNS